VVITPTRVLFGPPQAMLANRLLREYGDRVSFLRVSFCSENLDELNDAEQLNECISRVFEGGIRIGSRRYRLLGWSNSQMRGRSCWFYHSASVTVDQIRRWVGNLDAVYAKGGIAKYASRLALAFSSSRPTVRVSRSALATLPDVERNGFCFTDGSGQITLSFARLLAEKLQLPSFLQQHPPSAYQIRFGGAKGVLVVNPSLPDGGCHPQIYLRPSQVKFESEYSMMEVLSYAKPTDCYLNQQIVLLLCSCRVPEQAFLRVVERGLEEKARTLLEPLASAAYLRRVGFNIPASAVSDAQGGFDPLVEPFFSRLLQNHYRAEARKIRKRTAVRVAKGRTLLGIPDDFGVLRENEVFVRITKPDHLRPHEASAVEHIDGPLSACEVIRGPVTVTKNPCLHPGDIRLPTAVDGEEVRQKLGHLRDVVVFSTEGDRDMPNKIAGSDLDGDMYHVCWEPSLRPQVIHDPMDYSESTNEPLRPDEDETLEDQLREYFKRSCSSASLGQIANAHKVFADMEGAECKKSLALARCHSDAVDFPKTGVPAQVPDDCRPKEWPDFMEKTDK
ncbi:unnamed protein product, partial [Amoebophrya sp. A120]